ncbi:MAG TPA: hypothetical protein DDW34_08130, partial [Clostridium sp.]|nr:hypothetical protein [Clostridium sp.]
ETIAANTTLSDLKIDVNCPETIDAPISEGQEIGTITAKTGKDTITTSFVAQSAVAATSEEARLAQEKESKVKLLKTIGTISLGILLSCLIVFAVTRTIGH